ncbi:YdgA family protein [Alcaligenes sp. WGS1538]|uniref:YdgA family protein n=1 Tax=Alcaligenes sp. WGS1538 TaxID=3366811 RepID=UPI00372CFB78
MKKSTGVVALVVALAAVYGGSTWYMGQKTEELVRQKVAEFNTASAEKLAQSGIDGTVTMNVVEYKRGVFSSDARYTVTLASNDKQDEPLELTFDDKISHGPLPLSALKLGNFTPVAALTHSTLVKTKDTEGWFKLTGDKTPLWADSLVGFDGAVDSTAHFEAIKHQGDTVKVEFSGGQLRAKAGGKSDDILVSGNFPNLLVDDIGEDPLKLQAANFAVDFKQTGDINVNGTQTGKISVDDIQFQTPESEGLKLKQILLDTDGVTKDSVGNAKVRYVFTDMVFEDKLNLGSVELAMNMDSVYMPAITAVSKLVSDPGFQDRIDSEDPQTAKLLLEQVLVALERKPVLSIEPLRWYNEQGETKATLRVDLQKPAATLQELEDSPQLWLQAIPSAQLNLLVSKPMLRGVANQLDKAEGVSPEEGTTAMLDMMLEAAVQPYVESKLLKQDDNSISTEVKYLGADQGFDINGQHFTTDDLMGLVLMSMM